MKIYNTLTRKKEEFIPLTPPRVNIYTCGVTAYDECHIGHARSLYIFDVIRRYLKYRDFKVNLVRNITDIDDKIINRANELKIDWKSLIKKYIDRYYEDLKDLGIEKADKEPRATENIPDMVKVIGSLIDKGYAYVTDTGVYFSVRKFNGYGKLSGQSIEQMLSGLRIAPDETKEDPLDFALWKKSKENEPAWDSPWGKGRPGWHIECSVMSHKFLKTETLDIHAGGMDLVFPHHENEIAQAEALSGKPFAKYWLHHGLLTTNGQKMAKSLGNFVSIKDFLNKYNSDVLKLFFLQAHYSQPIDFSWQKVEERREALNTITIFLKRVKQREETKGFIVKAIVKKTASAEELRKNIKEASEAFEKSMDDDFNTPNAIAVLFEIIRTCNKVLYSTNFTKRHLPVLKYAVQTIKKIGDIFGLSFEAGRLTIPEKEIKDSIKLRENLRKKKMFKEADQIRSELAEEGIILEDTEEGTGWRRKI